MVVVVVATNYQLIQACIQIRSYTIAMDESAPGGPPALPLSFSLLRSSHKSGRAIINSREVSLELDIVPRYLEVEIKENTKNEIRDNADYGDGDGQSNY